MIKTVVVDLFTRTSIDVEVEVDEFGSYNEDEAYDLAMEEIRHLESLPYAINRDWDYEGSEIVKD